MSASAFAQWRVEGTVVDELSKKPLEGVKVHVNASAWQVTTNGKGKYALSLPEGEYLIIYSLNGYTRQEQLVSVGGEKITQELHEVSLTADVVQESEQMAVINESELEVQDHGASIVRF